MLQADGAQRRDPGHDPPRSGVPGGLIQPPGLQRVHCESLTGGLQPPRPALAWTPRSLDTPLDTQPLLFQPRPYSPSLKPPDPGHSQCAVGECCYPFKALSHKLTPYLGKFGVSLTLLNKKGLLRMSMSSGSQICSNTGETELLLCDTSD